MTFYIGIDGGGSKTSCAVGDADAMLATARTGPCNLTRVTEGIARESLHQAVRQACAAAGIEPVQVARTCIGAAGAAEAARSEIVRRILSEILPAEIIVIGDMEIAVEAAFGSGPGVIVIAGTGSIAYGRDLHGTTSRAGGWGFAISDEGSAHWIGRSALTAFLRDRDCSADAYGAGPGKSTSAETELPHPRLLQAWTEAWGVATVEDLLRAANAQRSPNFAALVPGVVAAADRGDTLAGDTLARAGNELALLAEVVARKLFPRTSSASLVSSHSPSHHNDSIPLAMVGGVFRHAPLVVRAFCSAIGRLDPRIVIAPQVIDPVCGALRLARGSGK